MFVADFPDAVDVGAAFVVEVYGLRADVADGVVVFQRGVEFEAAVVVGEVEGAVCGDRPAA